MTETEIIGKPYETDDHQHYGNKVLKQYQYVRSMVRDPEEPDTFTRLSPDLLSMMLTELTAYYETAAMWLADEKLHLADLKLAREFKFNDTYLMYKQRKSETNETSRVHAKMICHADDEIINKAQHTYDRVTAWRKAVGRWIDTARTQLSYEKTMANFS